MYVKMYVHRNGAEDDYCGGFKFQDRLEESTTAVSSCAVKPSRILSKNARSVVQVESLHFRGVVARDPPDQEAIGNCNTYIRATQKPLLLGYYLTSTEQR